MEIVIGVVVFLLLAYIFLYWPIGFIPWWHAKGGVRYYKQFDKRKNYKKTKKGRKKELARRAKWGKSMKRKRWLNIYEREKARRKKEEDKFFEDNPDLKRDRSSS